MEIGPDVSLLPVVGADDPSPQMADEIASATGPIRSAAESFFDAPGESADAIRATYEAELAFLGAVFGFEPADDVEPLPLEGLEAWRARRRSMTVTG